VGRYYGRDGRQLTLDEWSVLFDDDEYKQVAETTIDNLWVSTVWLGLDHNIWGHGPPLIFETMVFDRGDGTSPWDMDQARYSTEEAARRGHEQMVEQVRRSKIDDRRSR
jgi:hypothetical protein